MTMTRRTFIKLAGTAAISSIALPNILYAAGAKMSDGKIPALIYHDISNLMYDDYALSPASFSSQMEWLYASGYRTLWANEVEQFLKNGFDRAVMLTFDDGDISFMDYAFPLLKDYGFKATINIIGHAVDNHELIDRQRPVLSWDECRYFLSSGLVDIGCHSYALHSPGGVLSGAYGAIEKDLTLFQEIYERELGKRCAVLAWPYGIYDKKCIEIARHVGFSYILTSREGYIKKGSDMFDLPRLNINNKLDLISFQQYIGVIA
jgi:peptidoglycan/xylan/chitin deacetylase (PgdA/CDA1 family)